MGATTGVAKRQATRALYATNSSTEDALADEVVRKYLVVNPGTAIANTAITMPLIVTNEQYRVVAVKYCGSAAVTADNTNYKSLQLVYDNANGGSQTVIAIANTTIPTSGNATNNWTANVPVSLTVQSANAVVPSGSQISFLEVVAGNGVAIPAGCVQVTLEPA